MGFNVATSITSPWEKEEIPDEDLLYMRVHKNHIEPDGNIRFIAYRNHIDPANASAQTGMSTDWQKYSTAEECRQRAKDIGKDPNKYEVIQLNVGKVREIPSQSVEHTPIYEPHSTPPILNRAHTDVFGEKDEEARLILLQISNPAIPFS